MGPEANTTFEPDAAELYLDIVRRSLLDAIYLHPELIPVAPRGRLKQALVSLLGRRGYPADEGVDLHTYDMLAVSLDEVKRNFERYDLLDDQVHFLEGWFRDTLPTAPIEALAVMRLDGDLYESTMDALSSLYPKLSPGGYVIIDDYRAIDACRAAVDDYRRSHSVDEELHTVDWNAVYWRRSA